MLTSIVIKTHYNIQIEILYIAIKFMLKWFIPVQRTELK